MAMFKVAELVESKSNPRRLLDARADAELLESVKEHGIITPLLLRKREAGGYEVVLGSRRLRAAKGAGKTEVPAEVRELDDVGVRELQLVENGQRADVHPLDESDAFAALIAEFGYDAERVATKVSKPVAHVRRRLQLVNLGAAGRKAWLDGKLTEDAAYVLSRVPEKLQAETAKVAISHAEPGEWEKENGRAFEAVSGAEMRTVVREEMTLPIADASFPTDDAELVKKAGTCTACPKRTGAQPALFADLAPKTDLCTDPSCWKEKNQAQYARLQAEAKAPERKLVVLAANESAKVLPYEHDGIAYGSGYVKVDPAGSAKLQKAGTPTYLGKTKAGEPVLLARVEDVKKVSAAAPASRTKPSEKERAKKAAERDEHRRTLAAKAGGHAALIAAAVTAAEDHLDHEDCLRALVLLELAGLAYGELRAAIAKRRGLSLEDAATGKVITGDEALARLVASAKPRTLRGLFVELRLEQHAQHVNGLGEGDAPYGAGPQVAALVKALGVNAKAAWSAGAKAAEKALDEAAARKAMPKPPAPKKGAAKAAPKPAAKKSGKGAAKKAAKKGGRRGG